MPYKITFKGSERIPTYQWTEQGMMTTSWKKGKILDEIIIKATGRNLHNRSFKKDIIYKLQDWGILEEKKRIIPLEVVIIHDDSGEAVDVAIPALDLKPYHIRSNVEETFMAVMRADIQYKGTGGIVYSHPFHKNKTLQEELRKLLMKIKK